MGSRSSRAHRNSPADALLLDFQSPTLGNKFPLLKVPSLDQLSSKSQHTKTTPQITIKSPPDPGPFWCFSAETDWSQQSHKARTQSMLPGHILQPELMMLFVKYLQLHFPCFPQQLSFHLLPFLWNDLTSSS